MLLYASWHRLQYYPRVSERQSQILEKVLYSALLMGSASHSRSESHSHSELLTDLAFDSESLRHSAFDSESHSH